MKFTSLKGLAIAMALFAFVLAAPAEAQIVKANIPFDFYAGEKALPAGDYTLRVEGSFRHITFVLPDGTAERMILGAASQAAPSEDASVIVFHRYGDRYFIKNLTLAGTTERFNLWEGGPERDAARQSPDKQVAMVIIR